MSDFQKLFSAKLVAGLLGISEGSVWRLSALGTIPAPIKISPGVTRWDSSEITQFLESKKAARFDEVPHRHVDACTQVQSCSTEYPT